MDPVFFILMALILGSVVAAALAHKKQKKLEELRTQLRRTQNRARAAESLINGLMKVGAQPDLVQLFGRFWLSNLKQALKLFPTNAELAGAVSNAEIKYNDILSAPTELKAATNDKELKAQQRHLKKALAKLRQLVAKQVIPQSELNKWEPYLKAKFLDVMVEAQIAQGKRCVQKDEKGKASTYFQAAANILRQSDSPEKKARAAELSAMREALYAGEELSESDSAEGEDADQEGQQKPKGPRIDPNSIGR